MKITSYSPQETFELAYRLGTLVKPPFVLFLDGALGSGKTLFTHAFAKGLGISQNVNSPTFVIMKIYDGQPRLVHVDAYRLENVNEPVGVIDELDVDTVLVVEWPRFLNEDIVADMTVTITYQTESLREIIINAPSQNWCTVEVLCGKL